MINYREKNIKPAKYENGKQVDPFTSKSLYTTFSQGFQIFRRHVSHSLLGLALGLPPLFQSCQLSLLLFPLFRLGQSQATPRLIGRGNGYTRKCEKNRAKGLKSFHGSRTSQSKLLIWHGPSASPVMKKKRRIQSLLTISPPSYLIN